MLLLSLFQFLFLVVLRWLRTCPSLSLSPFPARLRRDLPLSEVAAGRDATAVNYWVLTAWRGSHKLCFGVIASSRAASASSVCAQEPGCCEAGAGSGNTELTQPSQSWRKILLRFSIHWVSCFSYYLPSCRKTAEIWSFKAPETWFFEKKIRNCCTPVFHSDSK